MIRTHRTELHHAPFCLLDVDRKLFRRASVSIWIDSVECDGHTNRAQIAKFFRVRSVSRLASAEARRSTIESLREFPKPYRYDDRGAEE